MIYNDVSIIYTSIQSFTSLTSHWSDSSLLKYLILKIKEHVQQMYCILFLLYWSLIGEFQERRVWPAE